MNIYSSALMQVNLKNENSAFISMSCHISLMSNILSLVSLFHVNYLNYIATRRQGTALFFWSIWKERKNDLIFNGIQPSTQKCKHNFRKELYHLMWRIKKKSEPSFVSWMQNTFHQLFFSLFSSPPFLFLELSLRLLVFAFILFYIFQQGLRPLLVPQTKMWQSYCHPFRKKRQGTAIDT